MKTIYLDHAATTPVHPTVLKAMLPYLKDDFGNAGAIYDLGRRARHAVDGSRARVAKLVAAKPQEIIFTGGGTESDNLAILGYARANALKGNNRGHIITTNIEHHAVLDTCGALENEGFEVSYLPVDKNGLVSAEQVARSVRSDTILASVMYANNEIGTVMPIARIGKRLKQINLAREERHLPRVAFHTDACQAAGYLNINVNDLGVDLMTVNGSKLYGPKGIGFLYRRRDVSLAPIIWGGGQEFGLRSGTENVAGIVGLAEALSISQEQRNREAKRLTVLRDKFISATLKQIPKTQLNGHPQKRLPSNINISILGIEGESAILYLDAQGIACATGSACTAANLEPSYVITALGKNHERAHGSLRLTLGRETTQKDLDFTLTQLVKVAARLRQISSIGGKND